MRLRERQRQILENKGRKITRNETAHHRPATDAGKEDADDEKRRQARRQHRDEILEVVEERPRLDTGKDQRRANPEDA